MDSLQIIKCWTALKPTKNEFILSISTKDELTDKQRVATDKVIESYHMKSELKKYNLENLEAIYLDGYDLTELPNCSATDTKLESIAFFDVVERKYYSTTHIKTTRLTIQKKKLPM